jgi:hypothetical protein
VMGNNGPPRAATITVAGQSFVVIQESGCSWTVSPTSAYVSGYAGGVLVSVQRNDRNCPLPVESGVSWITPMAGGCSDEDDYPGAWRDCWVALFVAANPTENPRTGGVMIGGQPFIVYQMGGEP